MVAQHDLERLRTELARELAQAVLARDADEQHRRRVARLLARVDSVVAAQGDESPATYARRRLRVAADLGLSANGTPLRRPGAQRIGRGSQPQVLSAASAR